MLIPLGTPDVCFITKHFAGSHGKWVSIGKTEIVMKMQGGRNVARRQRPSKRFFTRNAPQTTCKALGSAVVLVIWDQVASGQSYDFNYTGSFQSWTVPVTGVYTITAFGAQGGEGLYHVPGSILGGFGAKITGDFNLTAGVELSIAVGGRGFDSWTGGGGGGGSFVASSGIALLIAGGGGGGGYFSGGGSGMIASSGGSGDSGPPQYSGSGGLGGSSGNGGGSGLMGGVEFAGGGGGFAGNGGSSPNATGGLGFSAGLLGGTNVFSGLPSGGFGGGGGYSAGGGGGGGYSGGGGGGAYGGGGGGGSFNTGVNQTGVAGYQAGNGFVQIVLVPEPSSFALAGLGVAAFVIRGLRSRARYKSEGQ